MKLGRMRIAAVPTAVVATALLALNVTGVAPIPTGPLGDHMPAVPDPGGRSTLNFDPQLTPMYLTALVENAGPIQVTVVRVTPVGVSVPGSVEILGSMPFNSDDPAERDPSGMSRVMLGVQPDAGPGWAAPQRVSMDRSAPRS